MTKKIKVNTLIVELLFINNQLFMDLHIMIMLICTYIYSPSNIVIICSMYLNMITQFNTFSSCCNMTQLNYYYNNLTQFVLIAYFLVIAHLITQFVLIAHLIAQFVLIIQQELMLLIIFRDLRPTVFISFHQLMINSSCSLIRVSSLIHNTYTF